MHIFRHTENLPDEARGSAVAIGNFDGVHLGHLGVIGEAGRIARDHGVPWSVLTFEPHPRSLFQPTDEPFRLTPFRTKARHIEELGVDNLFVLHFDKDFAAQSAEDFISKVLVGNLGARHVVSGYDFVFGNKRVGNCDLLLHRGKQEGFDFSCVAAIDDGDKIYSSTRVRKCLRKGDARGAASVLGRPFEIEGRVEHGDARGRAIGTPTANVHLEEYIWPALGVYAIRAGLDEDDGPRWYDGVANLGLRPTFNGEGVVLEAHLFDFDGDLYGRHLRVAFIEQLRDEQKFDGIDALKAQISDDCDAARRILGAEKADKS